MINYIVHLSELPTYFPTGHSRTTNRRLLGPDVGGSSRFEVIYGKIEPGGQADPHAHQIQEQAIYVLSGKGEVEIEEKCYPVGPQDFIYLPPGTSHKVTPVEESPLELLIIYSPPLSSVSHLGTKSTL
ncbi:MAG: cupin domain-containing protein [Thermodesulfobacteriota bacterium]